MLVRPDVIVTPDCPTVQFREPKEKVDIEKELQRVMQFQGWGAGTYFHVQFMDHEKTKVLSCGRFIVVEASEHMITTEPTPYHPQSKQVTTYKAQQLGGWWMVDDASKGQPSRRKTAA